MKMQFKFFESDGSWNSLFAQAAEFCTSIGPKRLVSISHSHQGPIGVVTVWYWAGEDE